MIIEDITTDSELPEPQFDHLGPTKSRRRQHCNSVLLGFFVHPTNPYHHPLSFGFGYLPREPLFIYTSNKGKKLAEGSWGNLRESLDFFIPHQFEIVGSSNGFLLCRSNNPIMQFIHRYVICNPVTGQFRYIPNPRDDGFFAPLAFVSRGTSNVSSLDAVHHQIVFPRAAPNGTHLVTETFCSSRNKWTQAILAVDSPFPWHLESLPGFAIDDLIFWKATFCGCFGYGSALLAYDYSSKRLGARLIVVPPRRDQNCRFKCQADFFGPSEGKVHYARRDLDRFEIWVLEDGKRKDCWIMKHRVNLNFPEFARAWFGIYGWNYGMLLPKVLSFHPQNSGLVFMTVGKRTFCYDMKRRQVRGNVHSLRPFVSQFFAYEWPQLTHLGDH